MERSKRNFSLWYLLAAVLTTLALQFYVATETVTTLAYSDFKALLKAGKVRSATVGETAISGTPATAGVETILPADHAFALQHGGLHRGPRQRSRAAGRPGRGSCALCRAGRCQMAGHAAVLDRAGPRLLRHLEPVVPGHRECRGGLMEIGKSKARVYLQQETGVTFADVAGIDEAKVELMEVVDFLKNPERYRRLG